MSRTIIVLLVVLTIFSTHAFAHCPENEKFIKCGSPCQTTCSNLGEPCLIQNFACNNACYCKEGYARIDDEASRCIPISACRERKN